MNRVIEETCRKIEKPDDRAMQTAASRWNDVAKPLHSLGLFENIVIQIAGITRNASFRTDPKALVVFCADNGVVEEGVTQTGQEVTATVAGNFLKGETTSAGMCRKAGVQLIPIDVGMAVDTRVKHDLKTAYGTNSIAKGPAMTRMQAEQTIETGICIAGEVAEQGFRMAAAGEMGIGNTTTGSAVASVLLGLPASVMTGRGAGLDDERLKKKIRVIERAIEINDPDAHDPIDVIAKLGGFDIAAMCGFYLGCAANHIPVVLDGVVSCVAALAAVRLCPHVNDYLIASHVSAEPAADKLLEALGKKAPIHAGMFLGEGTGAVSLFTLIDMAVDVYRSMSTFAEIEVEPYRDYNSPHTDKGKMI